MPNQAVPIEWIEAEQQAKDLGFRCIIGIDEAGCGSLAGPVVAACVLLPACFDLPGLNDSKRLSTKRREELYSSLAVQTRYGVASASAQEIDSMNIRQASFLAMQRALQSLTDRLTENPDYLLVDCFTLPFWSGVQRGIVKGDTKVRSIAAASIIAKVTRDGLMTEAAQQYPLYHFERHKGYPTVEHYRLLREHGLSEFHRTSFLRQFFGEANPR